MRRQSLVVSRTRPASSSNKNLSKIKNWNVIACLFSADRKSQAQNVIFMRQNRERYILSQRESQPEHDSRESTISENDENNASTHYSKLQLIFNSRFKVSQEFMIETNENCCDIVLSKSNKISRRHYCLTFDKKRRLILRDLLMNEIIVTYDEQEKEKRRIIVTKNDKERETCHHFTWILSDVELNEIKRIVVKIDDIEFSILISKRQTHFVLYNNHVDRFLQETNANNELSFDALSIQSTTSIVQHSEIDTFNLQKSIYIDQFMLDNDQFSIVNRVWDVSTEFVYVFKKFFNMKKFEWKKKAFIMSQILQLSNVNVSRLRKISANFNIEAYCTICCFN